MRIIKKDYKNLVRIREILDNKWPSEADFKEMLVFWQRDTAIQYNEDYKKGL